MFQVTVLQGGALNAPCVEFYVSSIAQGVKVVKGNRSAHRADAKRSFASG
jgi:hypothetical protein